MPPRIEIARWTIAIIVGLVLFVASARDIGERRIPNWTVAVVASLFVVWAFVAPGVSVLSSLGAAAIVFAVTVGLFAANVIGAGDSKLMTALALFAGLSLLPMFVVGTALFGGGLAILSVLLRSRRALFALRLPGKDEMGRGIPYGVAISLSGALVILHELSCFSRFDTRLICF